MLASDWNPLVSIIIPVYNGSNFLHSAIESALAQTYKNIEVIVINDGSRDDGATERIALSYGDRIRYFYKENGGVATALNWGIENMRGEYFSWLSHDDVYHPNKISKQLAALWAAGELESIAYTDYACIDENGDYLHSVIRATSYTYSQLRTPLFVLTRGLIHGCSLLIHRSHFEQVGIFNEALRTTQDYDLWFRIFRYSRIVYIEDILVYSRQHAGQDSRKLSDICIKEGNDLFIGFMKNITDQEICMMDGDAFTFYKNMWKFLALTTHYDQAIVYAKKEMKKHMCKRRSHITSYSEEKKWPMVTVAVYNTDDRNLKDTINSILEQTYKNIEIIIIQDADTCFGSLEEDKGIRQFRSPKNGITTALNLAIEKMQGDYFTWIIAGEQYLPDKIRKQVEVLLKYDAPAATFCDYYILSSHNKKKITMPQLSHGHIGSFLKTDVKHMLKPSTIMLPKYLLNICGKFDESLSHSWDYDMWLRLNRIAIFLQISDALLITIHQEPLSQEGKEKEIEKFQIKAATEASLIALGNNMSKRWINVLLLSLKKEGMIITLAKIIRKLRFGFR